MILIKGLTTKASLFSSSFVVHDTLTSGNDLSKDHGTWDWNNWDFQWKMNFIAESINKLKKSFLVAEKNKYIILT